MTAAADFEFGGTPTDTDPEGERVEDVTFDDVSLGRGALPVEPPTGQNRPDLPTPAAQQPPAHGVTAGQDVAALFADLDGALDLGPVDLPVPLRRSLVRYERLLDTRRMQPWRAAAYDREVLEGIDLVRLASLGLAELCVGFVTDGRLVLGDDSQPLTFRSREIQSRLGVDPKAPDAAVQAVLRHYAMTAHVTATWTALLSLSGFSDVIAPPERPSPT